jgi:hypothetical protein
MVAADAEWLDWRSTCEMWGSLLKHTKLNFQDSTTPPLHEPQARVAEIGCFHAWWPCLEVPNFGPTSNIAAWMARVA